MNAGQLGLPTNTLNDSILIEFGPKQIQAKLEEEDDLGINKPKVELDLKLVKNTRKPKIKKKG